MELDRVQIELGEERCEGTFILMTNICKTCKWLLFVLLYSTFVNAFITKLLLLYVVV